MINETKTLHERLRKAAGSYNAIGNDLQYMEIYDHQLAAIEAAIREDATAPLRAEVERLGKLVATWGLVAIERRAQYDALKARADALRDAAEKADDMIGSEGEEQAMVLLYQARVAYDAADRAGETQDGTPYDGIDFLQAAHDSAERDARYHEAKTSAPSPTDAAAGDDGEAPSMVDQHEAMLHGQDLRLTELEARHEGVDRSVESLKDWRDNLADRQSDLESKIDFLHSDTDKRLLALEARQGGVSEVVTDEMVDAFDQEYYNRTLRNPPASRSVRRYCLAAALAVMGTGGGRS